MQAELSDLRVQADEVKVKQIVFNLLSNAAKFTPDGGRIEISAQLEAEEVVISVADTGIGLNPQDQERIFAPFEQADLSNGPGRRSREPVLAWPWREASSSCTAAESGSIARASGKEASLLSQYLSAGVLKTWTVRPFPDECSDRATGRRIDRAFG